MSWIKKYNSPLVIAGPCSAESEEQVLQTAHQLKNSKVSIFRAGIWKPRTRPGSFEGVGSVGLPWLQTVKKETGLQTAIEVATKEHVEQALKHDVDVLWIGARTTVNPFTVQEIAEVLQGTDKTVLIKNPVNPDISLWMGAVERLSKANITNIGLIHRGFSKYEKGKYRNPPEWQIAIDMQNLFPDLPMIIDPSHISGNRELIFEVTQEALDLNYSGMIIETHINPEKAWSDAAQQVTPDVLKQIISKLVIRKKTDETDEFQQKMLKLRKQIDAFDENLIQVLASRMQTAEQIGQLKKEKNVAVLQNERWAEILQKMIVNGSEKGLTKNFLETIFKAIHQESITHQEKILKI